MGSSLVKKACFLIKTAKESTVAQDFAAGLDPTGVLTFRNATKNEKDHGKHKNIGVAGGFLGGYAISTGLGAAGLAGLAKVTGKNSLGKMLSMGAKDSLGAMNPKTIRHAYSQAKKSSKLTTRSNKVIDEASKYNQKGFQNVNMSDAKRSADEVKQLDKDRLKFRKSDKYGDSPERSIGRSIGVLGGATAGILGGGLGAASANAQYNLAREMKSKNQNKYE